MTANFNKFNSIKYYKLYEYNYEVTKDKDITRITGTTISQNKIVNQIQTCLSIDKILLILVIFRAGYLSVYELSYMWYSAVACVTVTVVGLIVSFVTGTVQGLTH